MPSRELCTRYIRVSLSLKFLHVIVQYVSLLVVGRYVHIEISEVAWDTSALVKIADCKTLPRGAE